jgi:hypothetical protein
MWLINPYPLRYMWVQNGKRVDSTAFSNNILRPKSARYFKASLGLRAYRQVKVSMAREFIPPTLHIGGGDNMAEQSRGHSLGISHKWYGLVQGDLAMLTEDMIWEFRAFAEEWWCFCGVGPRPPQQPLRQVRQGLPSGSNTLSVEASEGLTELVDKAVTSALEKAIPRLFRRVEEEIVENLLPAMIESAMEKSLGSQPSTAESSNLQTTNSSGPDRDIIEISSDTVMEISSDDGYVDEDAIDTDDDEYLQTEDEVDEDDDDELEYGELVDHDEGNNDDRGGGGGGSGSGGADGGNHGSDEGGRGGSGSGAGDEGRRSDRSGGGGGRQLRSAGSRPSTRAAWQAADRTLKISHSLEAFEELISKDDAEPCLRPTPPSALSALQARAREGIRRALKDPFAMEKSPEQLEMICAALDGGEDFVTVIPTGGGKSLVWDATALAKPDFSCAVIVPYTAVLDQHLEKSNSRGIVAYKHVADTTTPPKDFQIVYMQPETGKTVRLQQ